MRIIFRVDGSPRIGGGHAMRCLTLADALAARGHETAFVCAEMPDALAGRIEGAGHRLARIDPVESTPTGEDWDLVVQPPDVQRRDAATTLEAIGGKADWIVVDQYGFDKAWEKEARASGASLLAVDDLANRPHACDMLLDQTFRRDERDYAPLVPPDCQILAGSIYAPLRPEFATARPSALARRAEPHPVERLLISLGSTDVGGVTASTLRSVLDAGVQSAIDVVVGSATLSISEVQQIARKNPNVRVHVDTTDMAGLMTEADLAIGAAGTTSWERCCLALPALVLVLAANQRFIAEQLELAGAHRIVSTEEPEAFKTALKSLIGNEEARHFMSEKAAQVTDGRGAERVCDLMIGAKEGA